MAKDIIITVNTETKQIIKNDSLLGICSENLQGKIIFTPKPFIDGICRMYIEDHGTIEMDKQEDCYTLDIKSSLLITPHIDICFKITEPEQDNGVPIFATKILQFEVLDTIESNEPIPEQYPQWKDVLDNYVEEKKGELDTYTTEIQTDLKAYKKDLEDEMSTTKDTLTGEITTTATDETNKFNTNAESKTNAFNDNATEKTTNYNTNTETKLKEYNDNTIAKLEEYNTNATNKVDEFNNNVDSLENELTELASQMPWNTTEIQDSIHVEDSAKYSRNKLGLFGNLEQEKREGYNLIDTGLFTDRTVNGITFTRNEDGSILINGTSTSVVNFQAEADFIIPAGDYTLYIPYASTSANLTVSLGNSGTINGTNIQPYQTTGVNVHCKNISFAEDTPVNQLRFYIASGVTINNYLLKWMLVKGTYTADTIPPYEPYGAMPSIEYPSMPVVATGVQKIRKCGKNECKITSVTGYTYVNGLPRATGEITINQFDTNSLTITSTENAYRIALTNIIQLLPNTTYTISYKRTNSMVAGSPRRYIYSYNEIDGYTAINILNSTDNGDMSYTFNTGKNGTIALAWGFDNTAKGSSSVISNIQIEQGDTATVYEPYTEETFELDLGTTELCKIVDENNNVVAQDRVAYKDGKWQFEKNVTKNVFENGVGFAMNGETDTAVYVLTPTLNIESDLPGSTVGHSCMLSNIIGSKKIQGNIMFNGTTGSSKIRINIPKKYLEGFASVGDLLKDLNSKGTPLTIYNKVKTVEYEDCTPAQSQVLDKLYKLSLQKGTNNIYVETENGVTTELQLTYMQDLMSQINELKQAMLNIGGN